MLTIIPIIHLRAILEHAAVAVARIEEVPLAPVQSLALVEALPLREHELRLEAEALAFARDSALLANSQTGKNEYEQTEILHFLEKSN